MCLLRKSSIVTAKRPNEQSSSNFYQMEVSSRYCSKFFCSWSLVRFLPPPKLQLAQFAMLHVSILLLTERFGVQSATVLACASSFRSTVRAPKILRHGTALFAVLHSSITVRVGPVKDCAISREKFGSLTTIASCMICSSGLAADWSGPEQRA